MASPQIKLSFSSFTASFWRQQVRKCFYNTFKEIKMFNIYIYIYEAVLLIEAIPRLKNVSDHQ